MSTLENMKYIGILQILPALRTNCRRFWLFAATVPIKLGLTEKPGEALFLPREVLSVFHGSQIGCGDIGANSM
jgi:hypothetical protein